MPIQYLKRLLVQLDAKSGVELESSGPIAEFEHFRAIIVLGDPGMGKTEELRHAATAKGARVIPVQQAIHRASLGPQDQRVYLDALDESRSAGGTIDALIAKLVDGGEPPFVLSCRVADWYGPSDLRKIQEIYGVSNVAVLRLLGFNRDQAKMFISDHVADPDFFVLEAERRGLGEWLENPNDLLLLSRVVGAGWPLTKLELFERSSAQMVQEQNPDHARILPTLESDVLLDAAGAVCTSLLIAGSQGVCLDQVGDVEPNFATLSDFAADPALVERIAKSNLFVGESPRYVKPRHRTTAEFLAGRWLARQIVTGKITLRRALAIAAPTGRPPTELRGILAWLITRLPNAEAAQMIGADPFGLLIYGDADTFDATRADALLAALEQLARDEPYFRVNAWADGPWRTFARPELAAHIDLILTQDDPNPHLLDGLLTALSTGNALQGVLSGIQAVLYNPKVRTEAKTRAFRAYLHQAGACADAAAIFKDCASQKIADNDGKLRIEIYRRCYEKIPVAEFSALLAELWDERHLSIGLLHYRFVEEIPTPTLAAILDELSAEQRRRGDIHSSGGLSPHRCGFEMRRFLEKALTLIEADGLATIERVANWRHLFSAHQSGHGNEEWQRLWVRLNDGGRLFVYVFERDVLPGEPSEMWTRFVYRLWSHDGVVAIPEGAVRYLIKLAATETDADKARAIAQCTTMFVWALPQGPDLYLFAEQLWSKVSHLKPFFDGLGYWEIPEWRIDQARRSKAYRIRAERERNSAIKLIRENLEGIRQWKHFSALEFLGQLYFFGWSFISRAGSESKLTKQQAYEELFGEELTRDLKNALIEGICSAALPSPEEQADWHTNSQHYTAEYAVLAAMELLLERCSMVELQSSTIRALVALAVDHWGISALTESKADDDGSSDGWFWKQLRSRPDEVIESIVAFLRPTAQRGDRLHDLTPVLSDTKAAPQQLTQLASAVLSELQPKNHEDLDDVLHILLKSGAGDIVAEEATKRLAAECTTKERAFWLGMGWLACPDAFSDELSILINGEGDEEVWTALRVIFPDQHGAPWRTLISTEVSWLAEHLGARFEFVERPTGVTRGTANPWDASEIVLRLVEQVSTDTSPEATNRLARLSEFSGLASYRNSILHALTIQRSRRRDKEFVCPSSELLKNAFEGTGTSSADDVVAVTLDQLDFLQAQYRGGDTTGWRKYWNTGSRGVVTSPKIEDHCRDILLDDIRPRVRPFGMEVNHATPANAGNEADASIESRQMGSNIRVPVEMKMSHNREVWTAPRDQLSRKYMIDPRSGARGIYIVFWTGVGEIPAPPNDIPRPTSAQQMQRTLIALLAEQERAQISIRVLDVSQ